MVRQTIMEGDLKWNGPLRGFVFIRFARNWAYFVRLRTTVDCIRDFFFNYNLVNLHDPDTQTCSHRTITTVCPACNSFATTLARRPRRWSRPSITIVDSNMVIK